MISTGRMTVVSGLCVMVLFAVVIALGRGSETVPKKFQYAKAGDKPAARSGLEKVAAQEKPREPEKTADELAVERDQAQRGKEPSRNDRPPKAAPYAARLIIRDDFERGFNPKWSSTNSYVIVSDEKHAGNHSAMGNTAKHNGAWDAPLLYCAKLPEHDALFVRFWLKFHPDYTWPRTANFMRFTQYGPGLPQKEIEWWHMGEKTAAIHFYGDEPVKRPSYKPIPMRDGKWHEYAVYVDYRQRIFRVWFDSTGDYNILSALFTVKSTYPDVRHYTHIRLPYYAKTRSPGNGVFWIDDVEVWEGLPFRKEKEKGAGD